MLKYKIRTFNRELYLKIENPLQNFFLDSKCIFTSDLSFNLKFVLKSDTHTHTKGHIRSISPTPSPLPVPFLGETLLLSFLSRVFLYPNV